MRNLILIVYILAISLASAGQKTAGFVLQTESGTIDVSKFKTYYFASFDLSKPEMLTLISEKHLKSAEISPKSYGIAFQKEGNQIQFRIEKPGYIMVRINESENVFLFAEKPEELPDAKNIVNLVEKYSVDNTGKTTETEKIQRAINEISGTGKTLYFPKGTYQSRQLQIRSNSNIYLARGAVLKTDTSAIEPYRSNDEVSNKRFISMYNVENVKLSGYGAIDGNGRILRTKFGDDARMRLLMAIKSKNIRIEGLQFKDPGSWNTQVLLCEDVTIRNVKLLNDIDLSNTDGFDPDATRRMLIEDCFAYCGDDNVAIKTTANSGLVGNVDQIIVRNCVFLTKKSALKIGTETRGHEMKNILFENNDVIESDRGIALYVSDGATLSNITYRNNRFERNHPDQQKKAIHVVVNKRKEDSKLGEIKDLLIQDCTFENSFPKKSLVKYEGDGIGISLTIDNLKIAGKRVISPEEANLETDHAQIIFKDGH
jgi:polygalacturonase